MLHILLLVPLVLAAIVFAHLVRFLVHPFGYRRRTAFGYGRRRHGMGGVLFSILALVALDKLFTGRRF